MENRRGKGLVFIIAGVVVLGLGAGAFFFLTSGPNFPEIEEGLVEAILFTPFTTHLSDLDSHRVGTGFYLDLLDSIGKLDELDVIAKRSAYHARQLNITPSQQIELLNVDTVLRGEFVEEDDRYLINAELIYFDRETGEEIVIWAREYKEDWSRLLRVKRDLLKDVISTLKLGLSRQEIDGFTNIDEARGSSHIDYLRALYDFEFSHTRAAPIDEAYINKLTHETGYEDAFGKSARHLIDRESDSADEIDWDLALNLALQGAGEDTDASSSAHYALARHAQEHGNVMRAEEEFLRALELAPNDAEIYQAYAELLKSLGQIHDSYQQALRAIRLDPFSPKVNAYHASHHLDLGETTQALTYYQLIQEIEPDSVVGFRGAADVHRMTWNWQGLEEAYEMILSFEGSDPCVRVEASRIYLYQGKLDAAFGLVQQALSGDPESLCANAELGYLHGIDEQYGDAFSQLDHTISLHPGAREGYLYKARVLLFQNESDAALNLIELANTNVLNQDSTYEAELEMIRGVANAQKGLPNDANSDLGRLVERLIGARPVFGSDAAAVGLIGLMTGQFGLGYNWLTTGIARREPMAAEMKVNPLFAWLKNDFRFRNLLNTMNLSL